MKKGRKPKSRGQSEAEASLEAMLLDRYGPVMSAAQLREALCFPSAGAFRKALARGKVGIRTFEIAERRGRFALTPEVAAYVREQLVQSSIAPNKTKEKSLM